MQDEFAKCIEHQFPLRRQNVSFYRWHFSEHKYHLFTQINNKSLRGAAGFLSHCKGVKVNIHDASTCYHFAVWSILDGGCDLDSLRAERELRICEQEPRRGQRRGGVRSEEVASVLCGWWVVTLTICLNIITEFFTLMTIMYTLSMSIWVAEKNETLNTSWDIYVTFYL